MTKTSKKTENKTVANWLIHNRFKHMSIGLKQQMPSFVEDAVYTAVYIVAGTSKGKVNVSPKLVYKCLMLDEITTSSVMSVEVGYDMSLRQAQRLAQTTRYALRAIVRRTQESDLQIPTEPSEDEAMERKFINDYYQGKNSSLYSEPLSTPPEWITELRRQKKYVEYGEALRSYRKATA